jgi:hypothetical protein
MAFTRPITKLLLAGATACFWLLLVTDSMAQGRRYQPQTPTLSPYLNLSRFNTGGLPNYYALVRPLVQQRQVNLQGREIVLEQQRQITTLQSELQRGVESSSQTGSASWFMTSGVQSRFLDTSSYYPEPAFGGRR